MNGVEHLIQLVFVCTFEWDIRICSGGIVSALFTLVVVMLVFIKDYFGIVYCPRRIEDRHYHQQI